MCAPTTQQIMLIKPRKIYETPQRAVISMAIQAQQGHKVNVAPMVRKVSPVSAQSISP